MRTMGVHHLALRCLDAKETVDWYRNHLGMDYIMAMAEEQVPTTQEPTAYMHVFLDAGAGCQLTFIELPDSPPMSRDENTPEWVQHVSFRVETVEELEETKKRLELEGVEVRGLTDHVLFKSIYVRDPSGHKIEFSADTLTEDMIKRLTDVKEEMLDEWDKTKKPPHHTRWLHEDLFASSRQD